MSEKGVGVFLGWHRVYVYGGRHLVFIPRTLREQLTILNPAEEWDERVGMVGVSSH